MDISNQGPTFRELSPMEVQLCSQGEANDDSFSERKADLSKDVQRTPISSQIVPMNDLGLYSQCSSSCATPSKDTPISTPKTRKRKGYRATKDRKGDAIKRKRSDDTEFRDKENETRLANVKIDREDPETRAKYNSDQLKRITNKLKGPAERAKHNASVTDKLKDPAERAKHNASVADKLKDPSERAKHYTAVVNKLRNPAERLKYNERQLKLVTEKRIDSKEKMKQNLAELERYITMRGELKSVILKYLCEIAEGPTFVCSCCGCLHFRRTVVVLNREKLVSTNVSNPDLVKQVIIIFTLNIMIINFNIT